MCREILGIHHVTAIAGDPQCNVDFYTQILGLRLVKLTINYDDPSSYHFYYGDEAGSPGSILTFFAWPGGYRGRRGVAQATVASFSVPGGSLDYWKERFDRFEVLWEPPVARFGEAVLVFYDPDGLKLELVAHPGAEERAAWQGGPIPEPYALRGFHSVTLTERSAAPTAALLTETMGFRLVQEEGERSRYTVGESGAARIVDLVSLPETPRGVIGTGTVHHIAWRTPDDTQQEAWRAYLTQQRYHVSPVMDRQYFHSIYYPEPGGVLFEIATDAPGFTADELLENLGTSLRLPDWLEPHRDAIQRGLLPLTLPQSRKEA